MRFLINQLDKQTITPESIFNLETETPDKKNSETNLLNILYIVPVSPKILSR